MFKTHLYQIQHDLSQHHRPKESLLEYFVQQRLTQSLRTYYKEVSNSAQYLSSRNPIRIVKEL